MEKRKIFDFLIELKRNNSKEWMDNNREKYAEAKNIWLNEIGILLNRFAKYDEKLKLVRPKDTISRINNNRRFHPNKPVYKDYFTFTPYSGIGAASFHVSVSPDSSFMGGGVYRPEPEILSKIRDAIDYDGMQNIISDSRFIKFYGGLDKDVEALKTAPKGYDKKHKYIDLLRRKNYTAIVTLSDEKVISDKFEDYVEEAYVSIRPLIDYVNMAVDFEE